MLRVLVALLMALLLVGCVGSSPTPPAVSPAAVASNVSVVDDGSAPNATLGAMPHQHDYWRGRERVTILDKDVAMGSPNGTLFWPIMLENRPALGGALVRLPDNATVFEGTGQIDLTVSWSDPAITGVEVSWKPTGVAKFSESKTLESAKPLAIPVTAQMTDEPHATRSAWAFAFQASGPGGAGVSAGSVHVKADIVKMRAIETFPAHPDLFEGKAALRIFDQDASIRSQPPADPAGQSEQVQEGGFPLTHPVPPETRTLLVRLEVKQLASQNPTADPADARFLFKAANTAFFWQGAAPAKRDGKIAYYKIAVKPGEGDSFYAKESQWRLWPYHEDDAGPVPLWCIVGDCLAWQMDVHATVWAFKDDVGIDAWPATG